MKKLSFDFSWLENGDEILLSTNRIEAAYHHSFHAAVEHLDIRIDEEFLTSFINRKFSKHGLAGLVSTLLDLLSEEEERRIVWQRILPAIGESSVAPIFTCADDCDSFCTVIVVEVERSDDLVFWKRFGLDESNLSIIGSEVRRISDLHSYRFSIEECRTVPEQFDRASETSSDFVA
ncbi:hypothetical protein [Leptospira stimsonii]|uniref:Uncharacterized protein n=1 Tax=Leptospira stimsonii TaxID=2202203 RepID=A0ABY2MXE8_9LEPT|nr:hypothetical protein [Leptospira stimsonii]TGK19833.1 hypothetical protein EHO98_11190 [Leptospira stimsonii]TGM10967.1 hypothetical protein EHQ90_17405 [Leptospira stimsonii]